MFSEWGLPWLINEAMLAEIGVEEGVNSGASYDVSDGGESGADKLALG